MPVAKKAMPEEKELIKNVPSAKDLTKEIPEPKELNKEVPPVIKPENVVTINGDSKELKPTKILYQRNRTAIAYKILDIYPLTDVLAMEKGVLDPERDGDEVVFDFLVAAFDDSQFVAQHYDEMTTEDIDRVVSIFKRLNGIDEKEEQAKNREAKEKKR